MDSVYHLVCTARTRPRWFAVAHTEGRELHAMILKDLVVGNWLVVMFVKCDELGNALQGFWMATNDVGTWTALMTGTYSTWWTNCLVDKLLGGQTTWWTN